MANVPEKHKLELLYEKDINDLTDEEVEKLIPVELEKWAALGLNPSENIHMDTFQMQNQILSLVEILIEKEVISENDLNSAFRRKTLSTLIPMRKAYASEALKARLLQGVNLQIPPDALQGKGNGAN